MPSPVGLRYAAYVSNWAWVLFGGAVTLAAAAVVVLWQAFKHLDLKIERLGDKIDQRFDQLRDDIAEVSRLVVGHDEPTPPTAAIAPA